MLRVWQGPDAAQGLTGRLTGIASRGYFGKTSGGAVLDGEPLASDRGPRSYSSYATFSPSWSHPTNKKSGEGG